MAWRWQDAAGSSILDEKHLSRRVHGVHEVRFDGLTDLLLRARGASVFDVGCNRGHVGWDFAMNGASIVHGCDIDQPSIMVARGWFSEHPHVESKFEVVDLEKGPKAVRDKFGETQYDIVLFVGVQHKLKRAMPSATLDDLIRDLGRRAKTYLGWNGYYDDLPQMDRNLFGMKRIHTSEMAIADRPAAIWRRQSA